jgi:hypothetical protein
MGEGEGEEKGGTRERAVMRTPVGRRQVVRVAPRRRPVGMAPATTLRPATRVQRTADRVPPSVGTGPAMVATTARVVRRIAGRAPPSAVMAPAMAAKTARAVLRTAALVLPSVPTGLATVRRPAPIVRRTAAPVLPSVRTGRATVRRPARAVLRTAALVHRSVPMGNVMEARLAAHALRIAVPVAAVAPMTSARSASRSWRVATHVWGRCARSTCFVARAVGTRPVSTKWQAFVGSFAQARGASTTYAPPVRSSIRPAIHASMRFVRVTPFAAQVAGISRASMK